jgi:response regulator of citrate/malate metabolism
MRTVVISNDADLLARVDLIKVDLKDQITIINESRDPLDVMSGVFELNPSLIIIDDDFMAPETVHLLKSIRKVNRGVDIIFCTSNTSIDLGKEITQLGIQYYAIKPLKEGELHDSFKAVLNIHQHKTYT